MFAILQSLLKLSSKVSLYSSTPCEVQIFKLLIRLILVPEIKLLYSFK
nr:MAG TPA: hypothetical protein [Caudoviricetes sp.]